MRKWKKILAITLAVSMIIPPVGADASETKSSEEAKKQISVEEVGNAENTDGDTTDPEKETVFPDQENSIQEEVESYGYDSIVEEAEKEQEYRDSVDYVDNTIVFSVLDYRKKGEKAKYLKDSDKICKENDLKKVEFILDTRKEDAEEKDGYTAYQVFYMATVKTNDIWQVVDTMLADENICTAEPDYVWEKTDQNDMTEISGETLAAEVECAGWSYDDLSITGIWNSLTQHTAPGEGVVVAVIDTGVDYNHVDLKKNMWINAGEIAGNGVDDDGNGYIDDIHGINLIDPVKQGDPMDDHGHGTHVAGIIGMTAGNGGGVGVAYGSKIMAIKAGQASGTFASTDIAKAVQYAAANGADVINMSFGGTGKSNLVEAALADAFGSCVLVAAAGNDGMPTMDHPFAALKENFYPAGYSYVLGVMACDANGSLASFSNWDYLQYANCEYEMVAPGVQIYSTIPGNRYARWSGTSMAAPMVAAAAAIIRREYSDTNKYSSRFILGQLSSATEDNILFYDKYMGDYHSYPKLNIADSLNLTPKPNINISDVSFFDSVAISDKNNNDGVVQAGETIDLGFLVKNYWGIAKDVSVKIDTKSPAGIDNPYIELITDEIDFDDEVGTYATINNGFIYDNDELVGVDNPIRVKISDDAPNSLIVTVNFQIMAKNGIDSSDTTTYGIFGDKKYTYTFEVQRGTYLRGTISEDMTLTADKLWIVDRSVFIPEGVTVDVDPGTQIQFYSVEEGPYAELRLANLTVEGQLRFNGTLEKPISVFPCKGREDYIVEMYSCNNGRIDLDYTQIINPYGSLTTGNHMRLVQNQKGMLSYITPYGETESLWYNHQIAFGKLSDSIVEGFFSTLIFGEYNRVLFNNNSMSFGMSEYTDSNFTISFLNRYSYIKNGLSSSKNSAFLINYSDLDISRIYNGKCIECDSYFTNNALLNSLKFDEWLKIQAAKHVSTNHKGEFILSGNYWGTTNLSLIEKMIIDRYDDASLPEADYSNYLTLDDDMSSIYPFVTEAYITDSTGENRLSQVVNSQTVQVHVKFNRDMSRDAKYKPMVSFGPAEPYTDYVVDGDWVGAREWVGTVKIDPFINQGTEYLRIKDAAAADDLWLTTGTDSARFSFDITKSSAEALTLQGSGGSNENNLNWVQDDYDTLAGYNLYRATEYDSSKSIEEQSFTKINPSIIANDTKEYTDPDVEQGQDYYYYFTVVDTQFAESPASNIVKCTPLDEEKPVIGTKAVETKTVGTAVNISADITDNVEVKGATLYYKSSGEEAWKNIKMRNTSGDTYQAVIPAYDVKEGMMQYYISAADGTNTTTAGSVEVPNVFSVIGIVDVESIALNKTTKDITIGDSYQLEATVLPENATDKSVTWSSSDESVATVDDEGKVTSVSVGEVTITAASKDGKKSAACNITVKPILVTSLSIESEEKTVLVEDTFTITPTVLPENATNKAVNYESGNTKVATVDADGKVTAVGVGKADITVTTDDDSDLSKVCRVTVNPIKVKSVSLSESSKTIDMGDDFTLIANIYPENATNKGVTWTSSAPGVATVVDGKVTALKGGKTTITVETVDGGLKAICNVTVKSILTDDITLSKEEMTLDVGASETLTVEVVPANATSDTFTWKSDDKEIAAVKDGKVTAVAPGKTFIRCSTTDGTDITKVCSVEVWGKFEKPAKPIVLSKSLTTVTLKPISGALYSKDGTNWVENNEFTGLTENTEYSFYIKRKADGYYHESDRSDATVVKTDESTISVTGIELDQSELNLMVGEDAELTATLEPENPSITDLDWKSTNTSVATVDNNGKVTAKAIGLAYIICKSTDGSEKTAICTVKVFDQKEAPETIETEAVTENGIRIKEMEGCEYRIGNGKWSDSPEFTGLTTNTEYEISARKAAEGYHKASEIITVKMKTKDHIYDQENTDKKYLKSAANCTNPAIYYKSCECGAKGNEIFVYGEALGHNYKVIQDTVVAPSCTVDGKEADQKCERCNDVMEGKPVKATGHNMSAHAAVEAECEKAGNTAYWSCDKCGHYFADTEGKKEVEKDSWIIAAKGHTFNQESAEEKYLKSVADCTHPAIYYKSCECGAKGMQIFEYGEALGHAYEEVEGSTVEATCTMDGKDADRKCSRCDKLLVGKTVKATGHKVTAHAAVEAECEKAGNTAYWSCDKCSHYFADAEGKKEVEKDSWIIAAKGHVYGEMIAEIPATCTENGVMAHFECNGCHKLFVKEADKYAERSAKELEIKVKGHTFNQESTEEKYLKSAADCTHPAIYYKSCECGAKGNEIFVYGEALGHNYKVIQDTVVAPSCTVDGKEADQKCERCNDVMEGKPVKATGHNMSAHAAVEAECEKAGNTAYWSCDNCGHYYADAECKKEIEKDSWIIAAKGHTFNRESAEEKYLKSAADCTHPAIYYKSCECGAKGMQIFEYGEALGHAYEEVEGSAVEATCTMDGKETDRKCSRCDKLLVGKPVKATGHNMTAHAAVEAECEKAGNTAYWSCEKCSHYFADAEGKKEVEKDSWIIAAKGHVYGEMIAEIPATCTENGVMAHFECNECHKLFVKEADKYAERSAKELEIKASGHSYYQESADEKYLKSAADCTHPAIYYKSCDCGAKGNEIFVYGEALGHDWGEWIVTKAATETEDGSATRSCKRDKSHVETRVIPQTGHIHSMVKVEAKAATCKEAGNTAYYLCSKCGNYYSDLSGQYRIEKDSWIIVANGHITGETVSENNIAPTCAKEGSYDEVTRCSVCGDVLTCKTKILAKVSHQPTKAVSENNLAASCEKEGSYDIVIRCSACGEELSRETKTIAALGHDWGEWIVTKAATETEDGIERRTCKRDPAHVETRKIPATGKTDEPRKETQQSAVQPALGTVIKDATGQAEYKVIAVSQAKAAVEYLSLTNTNVTTVTIPSEVKIGNIPYKVTSVAENAFKGNKTIKKITTGKNLTTIGANAFNGCTSLKKITIPEGVKTIGANAFKGCKNLKTITIKSTVLTKVGKNAFKGIHAKAKIKVPKKQKKAYEKLLKKKGQASTVKIK